MSSLEAYPVGTMSRSIRLQTSAKLNLALSVGPAGVDRMHPIASWMVTIDLMDDIEIHRLEEPTLSLYAVHWHREAVSHSDIDWPMSRDLAARAHQALERHAERMPIRMRIEKRIPLGSGLGGGSSDAAAVLRQRSFELGLSLEELAEVGSGIGSDVPLPRSRWQCDRRRTGRAGDPLPEAARPRCGDRLPRSALLDRRGLRLVRRPGRGGRGGRDLAPEAVRSLAAASPTPPDAPFNDLAEPAVRPNRDSRNTRGRDRTTRGAAGPRHRKRQRDLHPLRPADPRGGARDRDLRQARTSGDRREGGHPPPAESA